MFQEGTQNKDLNFDESRVQKLSTVPSIKQLKIINLQMLLPIKMAYLLLMNHHAMLCGNSMSNATP